LTFCHRRRRAEREHKVDIRNIAHFRHVYDSAQPDRRRLYEQAKVDQWNAATDAGGDETAFRKYFRRDLHARLVRNLRKVGVLTPHIEPDVAALGISLGAA
jgi:hypothetical protein